MAELFRVRLVNVRPKANVPQLDTGEFSFSGDVLTQLPRYFEYIDLMRKVDLDAYEMFSRLGASLMPPDKAVMTHRPENVEPHYALDEVPSFGCLYLPVKDNDPRKVFADFIWWRKLDGSLPGVEASHGATVFHVTALYHDRHRALLPMSFNIVAPSIGGMRVLKEYTLSSHSMYDHKSQKDRRSYIIKRNEWQFPHVLKTIRAMGISDDASAVQTMTMAEVGVLMQRHIRTNAWTKARRRRKKR